MNHVDYVSAEYISLVRIDDDIEKFGISGYADYYWTREIDRLADTLKKIESDKNALEMANEAIKAGRYVHIYIVSRLKEDVMEELSRESIRSSGVVIKEIEDENPPYAITEA